MMETKYTRIVGTEAQIKQLIRALPTDIDTIVEAVQDRLGLKPDETYMEIYLYNNATEVQQAYRRIYGQPFKSVAFTSLSTRAIHLALWNRFFSSPKRLYHEIGHVIFEAALGNPCFNGDRWSYKHHELQAQIAERTKL